MSTLKDYIRRGTRAAQPVTQVSEGELYCVTDEGNIVERSNGTTWDAFGADVSALNGGYVGVKGADIASAATVDLSTATGDWVDVTGTMTITALGTVTSGVERLIRFTGILTLTHNGTSLILPTAANITTAAGDFARFRSLGSGNWVCVAYQRASGAALASAGGSLTNWTEAVNTSAPNATVPVVSFTATNAAATTDAALVAKGANGATLAQIPDNTTTGGNKRGSYATDWQKSRTNAADVASGTGSTIGGGERNRASNNYATVGGGRINIASGGDAVIAGGESNDATGSAATVGGGSNCNATANYATVSGGQNNTASATHATAAGGSNVTASGAYSHAVGRNTTADGIHSTAAGYGAQARGVASQAYSGFYFSVVGDAQRREFTLLSDTSNATPEAVTTDNSSAGTDDQIVLPNNSLYAFQGTIVVRENATGDAKAIKFEGAIKRGANAAATALVGTPTQADLGADAGASAWTLAMTADTTNGALKLEVTGEASHSLKWVARVTTTEVVG